MSPQKDEIEDCDAVPDLKLKVGLLGRDVAQITALFERLEHSIDKIQEVNTSLLRMITLHEEKHEQHERVQTTVQQDIKELHSRITSAMREVGITIEKVEERIMKKIEETANKVATYEEEQKDDISVTGLNKFGKIIWIIIVAVFFAGYYFSQLQPIMTRPIVPILP